MKNRIIKFSGGKSSGAVAAWVKENYPDDNIVLYFNDVLWEDEDLYRFNKEISDKLQLPLITQSRGITPMQLMVEKKFLANNRAGICSQELKIKVAQRFFFKGIVPEVEYWYNEQYLKQSIHSERNESFFENTILYFGISWDEMHRAEPIKTNWQPYTVEFPLIEEIYDKEEFLKKYDIEEPRLYKQNFTHNNCGGRCVKAGKGHFQNLLSQNEESFMELLEQELVVGWYTRYVRQATYSADRDYMKKDVYEFVTNGTKSAKIEHIIRTHKHTKNNIFGRMKVSGEDIKKPFSFMKGLTLEEFEKQAMQLDMWSMLDIGGCGCSTDYGTCKIE